MKNKLFLVLLLLLFTGVSQAQWQPDVRLTNDPANSITSFNNAWCIAASGNIVHVVWSDSRDVNYEIYYKRSIDNGTSWEEDTRLTNYFSQSPSLAVSGSFLHVVWVDGRDGNWEIYYKRSTDGGTSWGVDTRLTSNSAYSSMASVAVSGSVVHVVWEDERDGNREIYYKRSTDGGASWGADTRLTNNSAQSMSPSVTVSSQVVNVAWYDNRDGNWGIFYKRSTDGGTSWLVDLRLTNTTAWSSHPCVSVSSQVVHVVWNDFRDGNWEIYYKHSTDGGTSWGADTRLTSNSASSQYPSISVSSQIVHVVWNDFRDGNWEIYYKRSSDGSTSWGADTRLTSNSAYSSMASVAVSGSVVHVVWDDVRDGNYEIYYKRNPTGNSIGINIISLEIPKDFSLWQNYPNPFNPTTKIRFSLPNPSEVGAQAVKLVIYDILGREVTILINEQLKPGTYEVDFNGTNYTSGVYFYMLITESFSNTKRMVLVK